MSSRRIVSGREISQSIGDVIMLTYGTPVLCSVTDLCLTTNPKFVTRHVNLGYRVCQIKLLVGYDYYRERCIFKNYNRVNFCKNKIYFCCFLKWWNRGNYLGQKEMRTGRGEGFLPSFHRIVSGREISQSIGDVIMLTHGAPFLCSLTDLCLTTNQRIQDSLPLKNYI